MILAIKWLMTLATICFVAGYRVARSRNGLHRKLMVTGLAAFLGIAVALVVGVHVYEETYGAAGWIVALAGESASAKLLIAHRLVATVSALFLLAQAWSGWRRRPAHVKRARVTMALWLFSYVSGLILFV